MDRKSLGPYEVIEPLGAGGMGEVYRAHNPNLKRDVAIKVLPAELASDPDRLARLEREAHLLAALNHPNVATIHGLEEAQADDGTSSRFLVLELVEGETLEEQLRSGPLEVEEALELAVQIARGLEAAHDKGIVHRDLKPGNVKITPDRLVKVLDFGLAKPSDAVEADAADEEGLTRSPTVTVAGTEAGVILGTAAYMSPEQARGKAVDQRTDVWSFGCVLYEMLAGRRPFTGANVPDTLASILKEEADWEALPAGTPPLVQSLLRRCLRKDPDQRVHAIADARIEIEETLAGAGAMASVEPSGGDRRSPWLRALSWTAAGLVGALAVGVAAWALWPTPDDGASRSGSARFRVELPEGTVLARFGTEVRHDLSLSPDGQYVIFGAVGSEDPDPANTQIYQRALSELEARPIPGTDGGFGVAFSWDGESIAFFRQGQLWRVPVGGGEPVAVTRVDITGGGKISWGPDGSIVYGSLATPLYRVSARGGNPEPLTALREEAYEWAHTSPHHLPGGRALLFAVLSPGGPDLWTLDLDTGQRRLLLEGVGEAWHVEPDLLAYAQGDTLMAAPFDPRTMQITGSASRISGSVGTAFASGQAMASVSRGGTVAYVERDLLLPRRQLLEVGRDGTEEPLGLPKRGFWGIRASPDGDTLVLSVAELDRTSVWMADIERPTLVPVSMGDFGIWGPGEGRLTLTDGFAEPPGLYTVGLEAGATPELLRERGGLPTLPVSWSPGGDRLVINTWTPGSGWELEVVEDDGAGTSLFAGGRYCCDSGDLSPDGDWIVYSSGQSGRREVFVQPFPDGGRPRPVSSGGGGVPLWEGDEIFYEDGGDFHAAAVRTDPEFEVIGDRVLFSRPYRYNVSVAPAYDVRSDGSSFLMIGPNETPPPDEIVIVLNIQSELFDR